MTLLGNAIVTARGVSAFYSFQEGLLAMQPAFKTIVPQHSFSAYRNNYELYRDSYLLGKKLLRGENITP